MDGGQTPPYAAPIADSSLIKRSKGDDDDDDDDDYCHFVYVMKNARAWMSPTSPLAKSKWDPSTYFFNDGLLVFPLPAEDFL